MPMSQIALGLTAGRRPEVERAEQTVALGSSHHSFGLQQTWLDSSRSMEAAS